MISGRPAKSAEPVSAASRDHAQRHALLKFRAACASRVGVNFYGHADCSLKNKEDTGMKRITSVSVLTASVVMLGSTLALAAQPTQADFDACNQMAQSSAQSPVSPSASPETKQPTVPPSASTTQAAPSDKSSAQAPVSPSASPETKQPTVPPSASTTQAAPSDKTAAEARVENQANQLHGIADASKDDARYKQAYRDCMKGRGY